MALATIEIWACVDANGDYGCGNDQDAAREAY